MVIGLAVMNALANKKVSFAELIFANGIVLIIAYGLEHLWLVKNEVQEGRITYERIELIKPKNHKKLMAGSFEKRTGSEDLKDQYSQHRLSERYSQYRYLLF